MFYGNRDSSSVIFLEALAALKDRYMGRFELYHFLAEEEGDVDLFNGMLDRETCDEAIEHLVDDPTAVDGWFICGPGPMMDAAEAALLDRGVAQGSHPYRALHRRPAVGGARRADGRSCRTRRPGLTIAVTLDGRTRRSSSPRPISSTARATPGLPAPFACKAGVCATCRAKVTKGKVEMAARYGLTDEEVAAGYVLTCQSVPVGDGVAVDYDA